MTWAIGKRFGLELGRWSSEGYAHVVFDSPSEYDPDDAHELVGERDDGFVLASPCNEISSPSTLSMRVFVGPSHHGASTVDQQHTYGSITILGDAAELDSATRAVLLGYQACPR